MRIAVFTGEGFPLWEFMISNKEGRSCGITTSEALPDVVNALRIALGQAKGQLGSGLNDIDVVSDISRSAPKIDSDVPKSRGRRDYSCGKVREVCAVIAEPLSGPVIAKIAVIRKSDVAAMRAIDNDNIPGL